MKHLFAAALAALAAAALAPAGPAWAQGTSKPGPAGLTSQKERISYSIGLDFGRRLKSQEIEVDVDKLALGVRDAVADRQQLTDQEMHEALTALREELRANQAARQKTLGERNLKEGKAFLAANKKKSGVQTTASGLQYKVIKAGDGKRPQATDTVTAHYRGTLIDGTEFDSSYARGQPASFPLNRVIPGWTEALQLMRPGAKWQVFIPADLAYGERGAGAKIGPHATLIFEIELIAIK